MWKANDEGQLQVGIVEHKGVGQNQSPASRSVEKSQGGYCSPTRSQGQCVEEFPKDVSRV